MWVCMEFELVVGVMLAVGLEMVVVDREGVEGCWRLCLWGGGLGGGQLKPLKQSNIH